MVSPPVGGGRRSIRSFASDAVFPSAVDTSATMTARLLAVTALALALTASPAAAATLNPLEKACYASTGPASGQLEDIRVSGRDFARDAAVEVLVEGVVVAAAPTDPA